MAGNGDQRGSSVGTTSGSESGGALAFGCSDRAEQFVASDDGRGAAASLGEIRVLSFTGSLKVFVSLQPCDLRKSFNGLHGLVTERLGEDPRTGALFVFVNQRRTRLKVLYWDGTGFWVMTNRLVSHCPLEAMWKTSLSVSPALRATGRSGNRRGSIGHACRSAA